LAKGGGKGAGKAGAKAARGIVHDAVEPLMREADDVAESAASRGGRAARRGAGARPTRPEHIPDDAAPFRQDVADRVPPYGQHGDKTSGVADLHDGGGVQPVQHSGYGSPSADLPKPRRGMNGNNVSHVEAHTAARMHQTGARDATLYINREPCPGRNGCARLLERMLPPGAKLTVYGPNGYARVFYGVAD
jgi:hypothetical protein